MNNYDFIIIILLLIIPLILMVLCYRKYVSNYCNNNNIKCLRDKIFNELKQNKVNNKSDVVVEGFFDGITNMFSNNPNNGLPVARGTLDKQNTDINSIEQRYNDKMKRSSSFPPKDAENKDSDNSELLNSINKKQNLHTINDKQKNINQEHEQKHTNQEHEQKHIQQGHEQNHTNKGYDQKHIQQKHMQTHNQQIPIQQHREEHSTPYINNNQQSSLTNILGTCNFFNDKCPTDYQPLGNFSISGTGSTTILTCGSVENVKAARAIAIIRNNSVYEINVIDSGSGFNTAKPPKISIEGGKGNGATAEAIIDDDGQLKLIKVINPGYNYTETPNVIIDAPFMNSSCHLCCKI